MSKRVLVVGNTASPMIADFNEEGFHILHMGEGDWDPDGPSSETIATRAREGRVDGILAADRAALLAVCGAATELGLPGLSGACAKMLLDRRALRECLARNNLLQPRYTLPEQDRNIPEGWEAGEPVYIVALDSLTGENERKVDHPEDVPLGTIQVQKRSTIKQVIVEQSLNGKPISVYGGVVSSRFTPTAILDQEWLLGFRFPRSLVYPADIGPDSETVIIEAAQRAIDAVGFDHGSVRIDLLLHEAHAYILDIDPCPLSAWLPIDLPGLADGPSIVSAALALATGSTPVSRGAGQAAAIAWIATRSGQVEGVEGEDIAKSLSGVVSVHVAARNGDVFAHTVDIPGRDRVGYVVALGADGRSALARAKKARDAIRVNTQNVLPARGR